ncbi:hypothetical protein [Stakelama saccharophila]|uniref:Secreted protein n=1 Tax=Stakelama saccharophila TaxID=3075605 RepID=A0ABZ0B6S9_9SPHN|nr:hypothetical protein [Stakelama sp. W311]WNO53014.1 hypothetical protein RPR59_11180 [Stakelama sp. W311]
MTAAVGVMASSMAFAAPVANSADAQSAAKLAALSNVRASKAVSKDSKLAGSSSYIVAGLAAAAVIAGVVVVASDDDEEADSAG